jgi:hypothetical protein
VRAQTRKKFTEAKWGEFLTQDPAFLQNSQRIAKVGAADPVLRLLALEYFVLGGWSTNSSGHQEFMTAIRSKQLDAICTVTDTVTDAIRASDSLIVMELAMNRFRESAAPEGLGIIKASDYQRVLDWWKTRRSASCR